MLRGAHLAFTTLIVAVLATPLLVALRERVPDEIHTPLVEETTPDLAMPVELSYLDYPNAPGVHGAEVLLLLDDLTALTRHSAIELLVATNHTTPGLHGAAIHIRGTDCRFASSPGAEYRDNAPLRLTRTAGCGTLPQGAGPVVFEVRFEGPGRVFVWTYRDLGPFEPATLYAHDPLHVPLGFRGGLVGRYVDVRGLPRARRVDLLAFMWQVSPRPAWLWALVAVGVALFGAGAHVVCVRPRRLAVRSGGVGSMALGTAVLYAIILPPFHGPDESHHFKTYMEAFAPTLIAPANEWQQAGHFTRLQFHPLEKFKPVDVEQRSTTAWYAAAQPLWRSVTGRMLGRALHAVAGHLPVQRRFLSARLLNSLVFATAVALAAALLVGLTRTLSASRLLVVALSVPTTAFFGMHFSNHAALVSVYLIVSAAVCAFFFDRERASWTGPAIGLGFGLAVATSRSALPMAGVVAAVLVARFVVGPPKPRSGRAAIREAGVFWVGYGVGVLIAGAGDPARWSVLSEIAPPLTSSTALRLHGVVVLAGFAGEVLLRRVREGAASRIPASLATWTSGGVAVAAASCLVVSLFANLPHLAPFDPARPPSPDAYVRQVLLAGLLPFRIRDHDFLLSTTFWGGFGWLDTIVSPVLVSMLVVATTLALLITVFSLKEARRRVILVLLCAGGAISLAGYALGALRVGADLHGRYVFGLYTTFVLISWSWIGRGASDTSAVPRGFRDSTAVLLCLVCAAIHGYCLQYILRRYF